MDKSNITDARFDCGSATSSRMAGGERRLQILREAMKLFSQRGFRGTTTKEIAQAAGVSEAMVFRHFATKDELYTAILDYKACSMGAANDPLEMLREIIELGDDRAVFETIGFKMLEFHKADPEFQRLLMYAALEGHQLKKMFWERMVSHLYEILGNYIRKRQLEGAFRDIDPLVVVRAFTGMFIQHSITNNLWDKEQTLLKISNEDAAREFAGILLNGIVSGKPNAKEGGQLAQNKSPVKKNKK